MSKVEIIKRPIEQVGSDIKKTAWSAIIEALILIVLGISLVLWPDTVIKILAYLIGAFFIVKGGFRIFNYFMEKGQNDFFNNGLLLGVISVLVGIVAVVMGEGIASIFRIIIGVLIIYESLVRLNLATKLASANIGDWKYILCFALIMLVLGIFITFNTGAVVALIGGIMIATGIIGIIGDFVFIKHINKVISKLTK